MGQTLMLYASLPAKVIDLAGNEHQETITRDFDCFYFTSKQVQKIMDSENRVEQYKKELIEYEQLYVGHYVSSEKLKEFEEFIEKYKYWNLTWYTI